MGDCSNAENVTRKTLSPSEEASLSPSRRKVYISIDEELGKHVLEWAVREFIKPVSDEVLLLHIRFLDAPSMPYIVHPIQEQREAAVHREESHRFLREHAQWLTHQKIVCKAVSIIGDPANAIVRKVSEEKADVLIMGSHQKGVIKRTLLGSVSDYCLHHCPCTVIVVK
ncbi:hypothetical protein BDF14DRAFT_1882821 [Spinellus fusiger]|nr:hypothetical protein BDF14DRAFT_1882821 [Spinellus fusiger]